jgi:hypothetical protein
LVRLPRSDLTFDLSLEELRLDGTKNRFESNNKQLCAYTEHIARQPRIRFSLVRLKTPYPELWDSSTSPAEDKKDHAHHQEHEEQKLRDSRRSRSNAAEPKYCRDQRNY